MPVSAVADSPVAGLSTIPPALHVDRVEERFVWWIWQTRRFDGVTARCQGHDIIFPGWFSTQPGPDFRDAIISDGAGNLSRGDIEIHVVDSDWVAHGHDLDANYESVILHVVLHKTAATPTTTHSGSPVPILELAPLLVAPISELLASFKQWRPDLVRCPTEISSAEEATMTICQSGATRFGSKVRRVAADVEAVGADEALYRLLAESLGYSENRDNFRRIAEALPFALLSSLDSFHVEQLLLAAAGLTAESKLLYTYIDGPVLRPGELQTFRVRPGNSPTARLRGLARLVHLHRRGLALTLTEADPSVLWKQFVVEADVVLVGKGRADDIVINVALPYLSAYHSLDGAKALASLPAPPDNRWVKALRAKLRQNGTVIKPYRAIHQQGLLGLSLNFCRYDHCEACPLHSTESGVDSRGKPEQVTR